MSLPTLSNVWLCVTPWTVACHVPLSMECSKQQNWSGLPFPTPGDLPDSGIEHTSPMSPALAGRFFTTEPPGKTKKDLSSVQFSCSVVSNSFRSHESHHARPRCPSPTPGSAQTHVHCVGDASNHLILCCPFILLPSTFPSIRVFSNESVLRIRWPKYWSFSCSINPSNEHSGLISFRMDLLDLPAV